MAARKAKFKSKSLPKPKKGDKPSKLKMKAPVGGKDTPGAKKARGKKK